MSRCNHTFCLGDDHHSHNPVPKARSFELPGDREQYAPDRPADVKHVKLVIRLDFERETISGTAYTTFSALYDELTTITFDTVELHVESVSLEDGRQLAYTTTDRKLTVTLDRPYHYGEEFTIAIVYHAKPRSGLFFVKPAPEDATRPTQAWTFGQPRYHSAWFPCHDAPNDRATTEIIVTVPAQFLTVSNGRLLSVIDNGATKTYHWRHDVPHATYLVSLVVGDFAVIEDSYNGKPVNYYVRKDRKDEAHFYLGKTPQMMRFFSDYTGVEYPYDTYAQTVVELYIGAMEHTTATTHSFTLLLDERAALDLDYVPVVAHELAHQWFGDLVTCRDWPNAWLNEGFATYFEELWNEHDLGNDWFKVSMKSLKEGYLGEDSRYRRPVVYNVYYDQGMELFDAHIYHKGAWVLHMLRHQLGETAFRRAIQAYLTRYREKEVITADLERTLEEVTGHSMARFFQQWVYSGGYPAFEVQYSWDNEHRMARVKIKQTQKVDELTPCFVTPVDLAFSVLLSDEATQTTQIRVVPMRVVVGEDGQVEQNFYFPLQSEPLMVRFDPDGWLLKTLKFERSTKLLRFQLAHDPDVLGRIEAAEALGEKSDDESFEALTTALERDPFWAVRVAVVSALGKRGSEKAQTVLIRALETLNPTEFSRVRAAIVQALGTFQAPQQAEMGQRSAQALSTLLEKGDVSYKVEASAAEALGKTRVEGSVELLTRLLERPTWMYYVERGVFAGLGEAGENRVVEVMTQYLNDPTRHPLLRAMAARGLRVVGAKRYLYSEEARQRAVTALCNAVEHDSWDMVRGICASALEVFGERRAIEILERAASRELDSGTQHSMRAAAHALRSNGKDDEQLKNLRKDLDELREESRKLKEQVGVLEAKVK
ncbi:MAG: M1 family metallopeptidase [Ktedonobacteraceae bacterium]|nr:M1 family metallopeptidase [Ktedonobacteraceae bacterium]